MSIIGNLVFFVFGGFLIFLGYVLGGILLCLTTGGAYVNYMASDESVGNVKAAYETNFKRLTEVKRKYDPTNFFNVNQNIVP